MLSSSEYIRCNNCKTTRFKEIIVTKLLKGAAEAVKTAPLDVPVTPMFKQETEVVYECTACGQVMFKEDIAAQYLKER